MVCAVSFAALRRWYAFRFNPLYRKGSLLATIDMMHGTADNITGPYTWRPLGMGKMGSNPAFVTYAEGGTTKYSLWVGGDVSVQVTTPSPPFSFLAQHK